jgi:hypothetical protein
MSTTAATLIRDLLFKVPANQTEDSRIRKHCARIRSQIAPFIRNAALEQIERDEANRNGTKRKSEWPCPGQSQRFPNRASMAGGAMRKRL